MTRLMYGRCPRRHYDRGRRGQCRAAAALSAQEPPAGNGGRGGRGGGRGTAIPAGESCPPGTTEIRPRSCMAPEVTPPSIVDYRPRSTLVTPAHMVPTAKYPSIDFHGHPRNLIDSADGLASLHASLDSLNVRMMISADNLSGDRLKRALAAVERVADDEGSSAHPGRHQLPQRRPRLGGGSRSSSSTRT